LDILHGQGNGPYPSPVLKQKLSLSLLKIVAIINIFGFIVYAIAIMLVSCVQPKRKNLVNKNQGWEPIHEKYKVDENTSRCNPKEKQKQTINKNKVKTLCKDDSWL
jgi:hypothetical protein